MAIHRHPSRQGRNEGLTAINVRTQARTQATTQNGATARQCADPEASAEQVDARFEVFDRKPPLPDMVAEVARGLCQRQKSIPPKYFYDAAGSKLFDAITQLPEYYLTRTEIGILDDNRDAIGRRVGVGTCLVEYGSGSSVKVRILLDACRPAAYVPVDISKDHLVTSARPSTTTFRRCPYIRLVRTTRRHSTSRLLRSSYPGWRSFRVRALAISTRPAADRFLAAVAGTVGAGGMLIVGVDAKKDPRVLASAYNDAAGVTARFNENLLTHINAAAGADFDLTGFRHRAEYNADAGRIEMYLDATRDQVVRINGDSVAFARGEALHTENSYKYAPDEFVAKAERAGFDCSAAYRDERSYFMVLLLQVR